MPRHREKHLLCLILLSFWFEFYIFLHALQLLGATSEKEHEQFHPDKYDPQAWQKTNFLPLRITCHDWEEYISADDYPDATIIRDALSHCSFDNESIILSVMSELQHLTVHLCGSIPKCLVTPQSFETSGSGMLHLALYSTNANVFLVVMEFQTKDYSYAEWIGRLLFTSIANLYSTVPGREVYGILADGRKAQFFTVAPMRQSECVITSSSEYMYFQTQTGENYDSFCVMLAAIVSSDPKMRPYAKLIREWKLVTAGYEVKWKETNEEIEKLREELAKEKKTNEKNTLELSQLSEELANEKKTNKSNTLELSQLREEMKQIREALKQKGNNEGNVKPKEQPQTFKDDLKQRRPTDDTDDEPPTKRHKPNYNE